MPPTPAERPLVLITIDGLRAPSLGCYGNTWHPTPGLDRLAAKSLTYDWRIVQSHDAATQARAWLSALAQRRCRLLTDDAAVAALAEPLCDQVTLTEPGTPRFPAASFEGTLAATVCAQFLDRVIAHPPAVGATAWLHLGGMVRVWDAPHEAALSLCEPDDPAPHPSVAPASGPCADADARFAEGCRYAAQVMAIDACVEALVGAIDAQLGAYDLVLAGLRGYALGEHGVMGPADVSGPYSEARHVPLLARRANGADALRRSDALIGDQSLAEVVGGSRPACQAVSLSGMGWRGLRTQQWLLIEQNARRELYVKPDDRWEANDVATRCDEELQRLAAELQNERHTENC